MLRRCDVGVAEALPEVQHLVGGGRRHVQPRGGVPRELGELGHAGVLLQAELVLAEAVAAQDLVLVAVPLQCADMGVRVDGVEQHPHVGAPELDGAVAGATARGPQVGLEGTHAHSI